MPPTCSGPDALAAQPGPGKALLSGDASRNSTTQRTAPAAPHMRLEALKAMRKGSLVGFGTLRLPNGLVIADCPVCESHGKAWASIPGKPILDPDGRHAEQDGKKHYAPILQWADRDTADRWSDAVVDLVRQHHPAVLDREAV